MVNKNRFQTDSALSVITTVNQRIYVTKHKELVTTINHCQTKVNTNSSGDHSQRLQQQKRTLQFSTNVYLAKINTMIKRLTSKDLKVNRGGRGCKTHRYFTDIIEKMCERCLVISKNANCQANVRPVLQLLSRLYRRLL